MFEHCLSLEKVVLSKNIKSIECDTFRECESLKEIVIQNGVKKIGVNAFSYCKSLEEISLPSSVEVIEGSSFNDCMHLEIYLKLVYLLFKLQYEQKYKNNYLMIKFIIVLFSMLENNI